MAHSHEELTEILAQRFFTQTPPEVPEDFNDNLALVTPRSRPVITWVLVDELLHKVSNRSAPGQTGHSWTLIKWTWEARPELRRDTGFLAFLFPRSLGSGVYDEINGGQ